MPFTRSLAHVRGGSQDEEKILLLPPFTPRPYYVLWLVLPPFTYKATIKKYILHLYKATNINRDKSYYSLLSSLWLNF